MATAEFNLIKILEAAYLAAKASIESRLSALEGNLVQTIVAGADAEADIAVEGITASARFVSALNLTDLADVGELPAVTEPGKVQFPTESTAGKKVLLTYFSS